MIFNHNHPLHEGLKTVEGYLLLDGYDHPLPESLMTIGGNVDLHGYAHPLPKGLKIIDGWLWLRGYDHPLPEGLTVDGEVIVGDYDTVKHKLPEQLAAKAFKRFKCYRDNHEAVVDVKEAMEVFNG